MFSSKIIFKGIKYLYLRKIFSAISSIIVIAIIARNVSVESFGIVALAEILLAYNLALGGQTFSKFIIYSDSDEFDQITQSSFWLNLIFAIISLLIFLSISGIIANFGDPY